MAWKDVFNLAVWLVLVVHSESVSDTCSDGKYGIDCSLECHCSNVTCDRYSGKCHPEMYCQAGWFGPTCQIENQAYNKSTMSSLHGFHSYNAVDGLLRTNRGSCFKTLEFEHREPLWLQVDLGRSIVVKEVWVLKYFEYRVGDHTQQVTARVGNQTYSPGNPGSQPVCFYNEVDTRAGPWLRDSCAQPIVGRYVSVARPALIDVRHFTPDCRPHRCPFYVCELGVATAPVIKRKPGKVRNVHVNDVQLKGLTVQWDAPTYTNLVLQSYNVSIYYRGAAGCSVSNLPNLRNLTTRNVVASGITTYAFTGLEPFSTYQVIIHAVTLEIEGGGMGEANNITAQTDGTEPEAPVNLKGHMFNDSTALLYWETPECANYRRVNHTFSWKLILLGITTYMWSGKADNESVYVDGTINNRDYALEVTVSTNFGSSKPAKRALELKLQKTHGTRIVQANGDDKEGAADHTAITAGSVSAVFAVLIIAVVTAIVVIKLRQKHEPPRKKQDTSQPETPQPPSVDEPAASVSVRPTNESETLPAVNLPSAPDQAVNYHVYDCPEEPAYANEATRDMQYENLPTDGRPPTPPIYMPIGGSVN